MILRRAIWRILPDDWFYADHLVTSARRRLQRSTVGALGIVIGLTALMLVNSDNWREVLAGAVIAWGTAILLWARSSHRRAIEATTTDLRRVAEVDLLHARLNHIAHHLGLPTIDLSHELEHVTLAREERLAHYAGLDEFRPDVHGGSGYEFWDLVAMGQALPGTGRPSADDTA